MDLSKVRKKILKSVRSARSINFLPPTSDRPEVPPRAAAAAAVARAIASLPPHERLYLRTSSDPLSIYGSRPRGKPSEKLEEEFFEEEFDAVGHVLKHIPDEEHELEFFGKKATLRLAHLDKVNECLSNHVMEHHEEMVKGMHLVRELERDLKIATVICMNGRRHLTSSMNEVSRDLIVTSNSKRKQVLLDMLPILTELCYAVDMQKALESHVEEGNYSKAFQVLSEYLQLLDSLSELSAVQEMSRDIEVWLGKTLQKLDSLLVQVCQEFKEEKYLTVVDAYALIGDVFGLAEKIQSFFMQSVLSESHCILKTVVQEDEDLHDSPTSARLTYNDLCLRIPESKFRICLIRTLSVLFKLMSSYHSIMSCETEKKIVDAVEKQDSSSIILKEEQQTKTVSGSCDSRIANGSTVSSKERLQHSSSVDKCTNTASSEDPTASNGFISITSEGLTSEAIDEANPTSSSGSPWYELRRDATTFVSDTLLSGRKNVWQLIASRVSVLLSSTAFLSTSIHQFLKNYEDLNLFILAGEAFCGVEASEFRSKLKAACENYFGSFHRQNMHAMNMVLERENWQILPQDAIQIVSFAGLFGDGAPLLGSSDSMSPQLRHSMKLANSVEMRINNKTGFSQWIDNGDPFFSKIASPFGDYHTPPHTPVLVDSGSKEASEESVYQTETDKVSSQNSDTNRINGSIISEDENEDLLADFIDEDSQLPSRMSTPTLSRTHSLQWRDNEAASQTGSSLCLLRFMDKYARLMLKLELANVMFFKGMCQLFEVYFLFTYETFGQQNVGSDGSEADSVNCHLKTVLSRITQDCDQWIKPQLLEASSCPATSISTTDLQPISPAHCFNTSFGLQERCTAADTLSLVAQILQRSKSHLQSMLLQNNAAIVEDFFLNLVDSVPDLVEHIHRTTVRMLLHVNGYVERIANSKWELKDLGMEHNCYIDLLLGEFKHYKTRLAHGGIHKEAQDILQDYGVEMVAQMLVEGLSRVKRCTDEGRALMSLDLQVLINGFQQFGCKDARQKLQIVEAFIKAFYLPETEYVNWAHTHSEYSKTQVIGLVNLVATMKGWKRKLKHEVLEKIES